MKKILIILLLLNANTISAQVTITPGATLFMQGNAQLTLQNTDLVNNGSFVTGSGTVSFTGNAASAISGSQPVQFYKMEINKVGGNSVSLQRMISITQQLGFISGFLDLNTYDVDLGTTGTLDGEQETGRIIGANGGQVLFSTTLNAPVAVNPANLGAIISSTKNLGNVIIKRGHRSQVNNYGQGNTLLRYYDIVPANNSALNATIHLRYFDGELNGLNENTLVLWKSTDNIHWTNEGFTTRNATTNYLEKTGVASFSRQTLAPANNPLPVLFTLFNVKCEGNKVLINWKTAQEQNSSHFNIERSKDGSTWTVIGNMPAAGNSTIERSYLFTDNDPVQNNFYRIAQYDRNGRAQFTGISRVTCDVNDELKAWPNPFRETVFLNITTSGISQAVIRVFDTKGALIKIQQAKLSAGNNQIPVDMKNFPAGMYQFMIEWNNGQVKKTAQLVKQ